MDKRYITKKSIVITLYVVGDESDLKELRIIPIGTVFEKYRSDTYRAPKLAYELSWFEISEQEIELASDIFEDLS